MVNKNTTPSVLQSKTISNPFSVSFNPPTGGLELTTKDLKNITNNIPNKKEERIKLKLKKYKYWKLFYLSNYDTTISDSIGAEVNSTLNQKSFSGVQINTNNYKKNFLDEDLQQSNKYYNTLLIKTSTTKLKQYSKKINLKKVKSLSFLITQSEREGKISVKQIKQIFKKVTIPFYILLNLNIFSQKSIYNNILDRTWDKITEKALQKVLVNFSNILNNKETELKTPTMAKKDLDESFFNKNIFNNPCLKSKNALELTQKLFEKNGKQKMSFGAYKCAYNLLIELFTSKETQKNREIIEYLRFIFFSSNRSIESIKEYFYNLFSLSYFNSKMSNYKLITPLTFNKNLFIRSHFYLEFYTLSNFPTKICNFIISDFYVKSDFSSIFNLKKLDNYHIIFKNLTRKYLAILLKVATLTVKINSLIKIIKTSFFNDSNNINFFNISKKDFKNITNILLNFNKKYLTTLVTSSRGKFNSPYKPKELDSIYYQLNFDSKNSSINFIKGVNLDLPLPSFKGAYSLLKSKNNLLLTPPVAGLNREGSLKAGSFYYSIRRTFWPFGPKTNKKLNTLNKKLYNNIYFTNRNLDKKNNLDFGSYDCIWESVNKWNSFYYPLSAPSENAITFIPDYKKHCFNLKNKAFCSGPGLVKLLVDEYNFNALRKLHRQNRLTYYVIIKEIYRTKQSIREVYYLPDSVKEKKKYLKKLYKEKEELIRRTKLITKLCRKKSLPTNTLLTILPVLPPDLRPIVKMGDQIAASDLNRLYQRVIYRNDRLKKFLKDPTTSYSYEMKYAQRLLQEAVDNLIQNGKSGVISEKDSRGRALKSLSDILKGKQGRFRQYLLGKRVDYSGRSVIVVGPKLKLHECGIPKEMALELYLPFLLKNILNENLARTIVGAKTLIKTNPNLIWELLREIMKTCPVLLNRAPTLHRLGIQAFQPKLIDGRAILLHPLVCSAFNADFDGDQMAVHIPITVEARAEAWKLMLSRNNLLSPATGEPLAIPSQDMVLGCYYLTTNLLNSSASKPIKGENTNFLNIKGSGIYFSNIDDVLKNYELNKIDLHSNIWLKWNGLIENGSDLEEPIEIRLNAIGNWKEIYNKSHKNYNYKNILCSHYILTTPGKILFNQIIQKSLK